MTRMRGLAVLVVLAVGAAPTASSGTGNAASGGAAHEDLAKKLQNPFADLITFPLQNITSLGVGPDDGRTNVLNLQPLVPLPLDEKWSLLLQLQPSAAYLLKHGWFVMSGPLIAADWTQPGGEEWTVPVGAGAGRVFSAGGQKLSLQLEAYAVPIRPDDGPESMVLLTLSLLFPR